MKSFEKAGVHITIVMIVCYGVLMAFGVNEPLAIIAGLAATMVAVWLTRTRKFYYLVPSFAGVFIACTLGMQIDSCDNGLKPLVMGYVAFAFFLMIACIGTVIFDCRAVIKVMEKMSSSTFVLEGEEVLCWKVAIVYSAQALAIAVVLLF